MKEIRRPSHRSETREVVILALLGLAVLYFLVSFLNATTGSGGQGISTARLIFFGPACCLSLALFFIYAWRVYFQPQYGLRSGRALTGMLLLHLGLNLAILGPFFRK